MSKASKKEGPLTEEAAHRGIVRALDRVRERRGYSRWDVLRSFLAVAELAARSGEMSEREREETEAEARRFEAERATLDEAVALLLAESGRGARDIIGPVYMEFSEGDARRGQFFTPRHEAFEMARLAVSRLGGRTPTPAEPLAIFDPACGSATLLIATAEALPRAWVEEGRVVFYGIDADALSCRMARLNFALHGLSGEVRHGDSLRIVADALGGLAGAANSC